MNFISKLLLKKNWRMRILGAVFSKFFGGKFATVKQILFTD